LPGTSDAEVAFVVADDWQGIGAGTQLLEQLVHRARAEGVTRFLAETLNENHRMQRVFRDSGLLVKSEMRSDVVRVVLDLRLELAGRHRTGLSPLQFDRNGLEVLAKLQAR
jgi:GNAT superfamily N-acetyltransferase